MKRCFGSFAVVLAVVCAAVLFAAVVRAADGPGRAVGPDEAAIATLKGKLDKMIPVQFLDTPLKRVAELLQREADVPFVLMPSVGRDETVNLDAKSMSIREVLDRSCQAMGADWDVEKGNIIVASRGDIARRHMETRVYDIRPLLKVLRGFYGPALDADTALDNTAHGGSGTGRGSADECFTGPGGGSRVGGAREWVWLTNGLTREQVIEQLKNLVYDTVGRPDEWQERGGDVSSLEVFMETLFIVTTATRQHAQLGQLLAQLEQVTGRMVAVEARFLLVQTPVVDATLALGKGGLVLDAKSADAFLDKVLKPESGAVSLGLTRTVCHNHQPVYTAADRPMVFLSGANPVADASGVSPVLSTVRTGVVLEFCPTQSVDGKFITLDFRSDVAPQVQLRTTEVPVAGGETKATIKTTGTVTSHVPATAPAPTPGTLITDQVDSTGKVSSPRGGAAGGTVTLEMPEQDLVRFRSAVRIPDNGAVVFAASARALKTTTAPNTEILLFIRVKAVN